MGHVVVVTGASSGIGEETARTLAARGAHVVLACRDRARGEAARARMTGDTEVMELDLASLPSVESFAADLARRHPHVDVFINNAGMWSTARRENSAGMELTWATNVVGPFALTQRVLPLLKAGSRIINLASKMAYGLDLDDVEFKARRYSGMKAYAQSKQANRLWTWALSRRVAAMGVTANAVHPGGVKTGIFLKGGGPVAWAGALYFSLVGKTVQQGAATVVMLAGSDEHRDENGRFFAYLKERPCQHRDVATEERLWALLESSCGNTGRP